MRRRTTTDFKDATRSRSAQDLDEELAAGGMTYDGVAIIGAVGQEGMHRAESPGQRDLAAAA